MKHKVRQLGKRIHGLGKRVFLRFIYIESYQKIVLVAAIVLGVLLISSPSYAIGAEDVYNALLSWTIRGLLTIANLSILLTVFFLRFFITLASYNGYIDTPTVELGWVMIRDVANMFFVVALLVIAFGTILGIEKYEWKRDLIKLILAAVFINFSNMIAQLIIDVAHIFTITFLNAVSAAAGGNLVNMFKLTEIMRFGNVTQDSLLGKDFTLEMLAGALVAGLFAIIAALTMGAYLVVMAARVISLWALIILSPLAFILQVLPKTEQYAQQWWSWFGKQVIVAPVMVFFLWLAFATLGSGQVLNDIRLGGGAPLTVSDGTAEAMSVSISSVSSWENMANYLVAVAFLFVGIQVTQQTGAIGSGLINSAVSFGKDVFKYASGYTLGRKLYDAGKKKAEEKGSEILRTMPGGLDMWKRGLKRVDNVRKFNPIIGHIPLIGKHRALWNQKMNERVEKSSKMKEEAYLKDITKVGQPIAAAITSSLGNLLPKGIGHLVHAIGGEGLEGRLGIETWRKAGAFGLKAATERRDFAETELLAAVDVRSPLNKKGRIAKNKQKLAEDAIRLIVSTENKHFDSWAGQNNLYKGLASDEGFDTHLAGLAEEELKKDKTLGWDSLGETEKQARLAAKKDELRNKKETQRDYLSEVHRDEFFASGEGDKLKEALGGINRAPSWRPISGRERAVRNMAHAIIHGERVATYEEQVKAAEDQGKRVAATSVVAEKEDFYGKRVAAKLTGTAGANTIKAIEGEMTKEQLDTAREELERAQTEGPEAVQRLVENNKFAAALYEEQHAATAEGRAKEAKGLAVKALGETDMGAELVKQLADAEIGTKMSEDFVKNLKNSRLTKVWEDAKKKLEETKLKGPGAMHHLVDGHDDELAALKAKKDRTAEEEERLRQLPTIIRFAQAIHWEEESHAAEAEQKTARAEATQALAQAEDDIYGKFGGRETALMRTGKAEVGAKSAENVLKTLRKNSARYAEAQGELEGHDSRIKEAKDAIETATSQEDKDYWEENLRTFEKQKQEYVDSNVYAQGVLAEQKVKKIEAVAAEAQSKILASLGKDEEGRKLLEAMAEAEIGKKAGEDFVKSIKDTKIRAQFEGAQKELDIAREQASSDNGQKLQEVISTNKFAAALHAAELAAATTKEADMARKKATQLHADAELALVQSLGSDEYSPYAEIQDMRAKGGPQTLRMRLARAQVGDKSIDAYLDIMTGNDDSYSEAAEKLQELQVKQKEALRGRNKEELVGQDKTDYEEAEKEIKHLLNTDSYAMEVYYGQLHAEDQVREKERKSGLLTSIMDTEEGKASVQREVTAALADMGDTATKRLKSEMIRDEYDSYKADLMDAFQDKSGKKMDELVQRNKAIAAALSRRIAQKLERFKALREEELEQNVMAFAWERKVSGFGLQSEAFANYIKTEMAKYDAWGEGARGMYGGQNILNLASNAAKKPGERTPRDMRRIMGAAMALSAVKHGNADDEQSSVARMMNRFDIYKKYGGDQGAIRSSEEYRKGWISDNDIEEISSDEMGYQKEYDIAVKYKAVDRGFHDGRRQWRDKGDTPQSLLFWQMTGGDEELVDRHEEIFAFQRKLKEENGLEVDFNKAMELYFEEQGRKLTLDENNELTDKDSFLKRLREYQDVFADNAERIKEGLKESGHTQLLFMEADQSLGGMIRLLTREESRDKMNGTILKSDRPVRAQPHGIGRMFNDAQYQLEVDVERAEALTASKASDYLTWSKSKGSEDVRVRRVGYLGGKRDKAAEIIQGHAVVGGDEEVISGLGYGDIKTDSLAKEIGIFMTVRKAASAVAATQAAVALSAAQETNQNTIAAQSGHVKLAIAGLQDSSQTELMSDHVALLIREYKQRRANAIKALETKIKQAVEEGDTHFAATMQEDLDKVRNDKASETLIKKLEEKEAAWRAKEATYNPKNSGGRPGGGSGGGGSPDSDIDPAAAAIADAG